LKILAAWPLTIAIVPSLFSDKDKATKPISESKDKYSIYLCCSNFELNFER